MPDVELKQSFLLCVKDASDFITILKNKLVSEDLKTSLRQLFGRDTSTRYLVDFYILFQIMQRLTKMRLMSMSYAELQSKMSLIKEKIQLPDELPDGDTHQKYFERMLDEVSI